MIYNLFLYAGNFVCVEDEIPPCSLKRCSLEIGLPPHLLFAKNKPINQPSAN